MLKRRSYSVLLVALTMLMSVLTISCKKDSTCGVPHGIGGTIDLSLPQYYSLGTVGGGMMIEQDADSIYMGHRGIYVVRTSAQSEFLAFECSCPKDHDVAVRPVDGWGSSLLQCPRCNSIFSLYADGSPVEGSATPCSLYQYATVMDNDGYHLHIY